MSSWWEPDDRGDVVLRHDCGNPKPSDEFDVCVGCGMTREQVVEEAGEVPPAVQARRYKRRAEQAVRRAAERDAIQRGRGTNGEV